MHLSGPVQIVVLVAVLGRWSCRPEMCATHLHAPDTLRSRGHGDSDVGAEGMTYREGLGLGPRVPCTVGQYAMTTAVLNAAWECGV